MEQRCAVPGAVRRVGRPVDRRKILRVRWTRARLDPQGLVYEYDPSANKWTKNKPMALPAHHVAFTELNGKFYAFGGFVPPQSGPPAWVPINNAWEYDPAHDSWKALAAMPSARGSAVAATVNGKIYVIGGAAMHPGSKEAALYPTRPHRSVGTVEEYDPKTNSWSERSSMPTARNHAAVGAVNNKIYVIGGRLGSAFIFTASNTNVVEEYDPATDQWGLVRARMPTERSGGAWGSTTGASTWLVENIRTDISWPHSAHWKRTIRRRTAGPSFR